MYRKAAIGSIAALLLLPELAAGAGTTLQQTIMAELRYDTNAQIAATGQQSEEDFVLLLIPGFQAVNQRNTLALTASYRPTVYLYFQNQDLNTISHIASLSADYDLSTRTTIQAEEQFTYSKESLEATLIGLQNSRSAIWTNTLNMSLNHWFTHKTAMTFSASDNIVRFDNSVSVDSRNENGSIGLTYQTTPETQLTGTYNISYANYDLPNGTNSSQNTHSLDAGFSTRFRETMTLLMNAGAVYAGSTGASNSFFDWVAMAEIRKTWQRYSANLNYTRRTTSSSGITDLLTINDSVALEVNHDINRNLSINVFGNFTRNHTKPVMTLDTETYSTGASANWRMRDWLSFGLGFSHFTQEANGVLGEDIERNHIFINLHATTYEGRL